MTTPLAALRAAVRTSIADLPAGTPVVVACSGGADSLVLANTAAWVGLRSGRPVVGAVVDHGLIAGSEQVASSAAEQCGEWGLHPVVVRRVVALAAPGGPGPEAAARDARRTALAEVADEFGAAAVLLGHTRDDQAETVLLGLARGSGARSLAGMAPRAGLFRRPFLGIGRDLVRSVAVGLGVVAHEDPWNSDDRFARARVRHAVLPVLERELGPGVADALARSADLLRADADLLDALAHETLTTLSDPPDLVALAGLPAALRTRVIRRLLLGAGCPPGRLSREHVLAVDRLVRTPGGPVWLPGGYVARRDCGRLCVDSATRGSAGELDLRRTSHAEVARSPDGPC